MNSIQILHQCFTYLVFSCFVVVLLFVLFLFNIHSLTAKKEKSIWTYHKATPSPAEGFRLIHLL